MCILKVISDARPIEDMLNYIFREKAITPYNLTATFHASPTQWAQCYTLSKMCWHQNYATQYRQIIWSPDPSSDPYISYMQSPEGNEKTLSAIYHAMYQIGELLAYYHDGKYYTAMALHVKPWQEKQFIHTHFIMDTINWENGTRLCLSRADLYCMKQEINEILISYGLTPIRQYNHSET